MKFTTFFAALLLLIFSIPVNSQDVLPRGFERGTITLTDNTVITGLIKDNMRNKASLVVITENDNKKTTYDGDKLVAATIGEKKFICIKGDFFLQLCDGELNFLQKLSDASSKPVYAGREAIFINGTAGKPGDYFILNKQLTELKLVTNKNITDITASAFINCEAALAKARETGNDIAQLKDAVVIFNNRNN